MICYSVSGIRQKGERVSKNENKTKKKDFSNYFLGYYPPFCH